MRPVWLKRFGVMYPILRCQLRGDSSGQFRGPVDFLRLDLLLSRDEVSDNFLSHAEKTAKSQERFMVARQRVEIGERRVQILRALQVVHELRAALIRVPD